MKNLHILVPNIQVFHVYEWYCLKSLNSNIKPSKSALSFEHVDLYIK